MYNSASILSLKKSRFKKYHLLILMTILFAMPTFSQEATKGTLIIQVDGIRNHKGTIRVSVFNSSKGFPGTPSNAKYLAEGSIINKTAHIEVKDLPYGEYAVSLMHDENDDKKLEANFFGIPKEGIGMSNDAKGTFGPPSFEQAKFKFSKSNRAIKINMVYY